MGCCGGGVVPPETIAVAPTPALGTGQGQASPLHPPRRSSGLHRAGGRTVNHFLAAVRRGGLDSVPPQLFHAYARYLGLDPDGDAELLWIAELAAKAPMPVGWTEHFDSQGRLFYYHAERRSSWWTHPLEEEHRSVHRRIIEFRCRGALAGDVGLGGLRGELWQLEAEAAEAEHCWVEHSDQDGIAFFFNRRDRLSSWTDPRPAIRHRLLLRQRAVRCLLGCPEPPEEEAPYLEVEPDRPAWLEQREKKGDSATDPWESPRLLLMERAAECPVCYDPLWSSRPSVLTCSSGRRICGHYFCWSCAQRLRTGCPLCRAKAAGSGLCRARALPAVEKRPWQWFAMVDVDGDGRLEQTEAVKALEAVLPLDGERLWRALGANSDSGRPAQVPTENTGAVKKTAARDDEATRTPESLNAEPRMPRTPRTMGFAGTPRPTPDSARGVGRPLFLQEQRGERPPLPPSFDFDPTERCNCEAAKPTSVQRRSRSGWWFEWQQGQGDVCGGRSTGGISADAFCAEGGMLQWIVENLGELRRAEEAGEPPDLVRGELERWFDFWDADADGGLSKSELLRALMKTLRVSGVERWRVSEIRNTIEQCFQSWAQEGAQRVSREAFLSKPDGLGELLLAALFPSLAEAPEFLAGIPAERSVKENWPPKPPEAAPSELQEPKLDRSKAGRQPTLNRSESGILAEKLYTLRSMSERSDGCARL